MMNRLHRVMINIDDIDFPAATTVKHSLATTNSYNSFGEKPIPAQYLGQKL